MEMMQQRQDSSDETLRKACQEAPRSSGWLKFLGVVFIIYAILLTLGTMGIGIVIAWLPVWLGVILFKAANDAEMAAAGMSGHLVEYLKRLNKYFLIQGILMLLGVLMMLIMMFVMGIGFLTGMVD